MIENPIWNITGEIPPCNNLLMQRKNLTLSNVLGTILVRGSLVLAGIQNKIPVNELRFRVISIIVTKYIICRAQCLDYRLLFCNDSRECESINVNVTRREILYRNVS